MKIIDGKAYKEIKLKELDKDELLEIIEDLQERVDKLEESRGGLYYSATETMPLTTAYPTTLTPGSFTYC